MDLTVADVKLFINGANCCGKTTFGNWLQDRHGYKHIDFEDGNGNAHRANLREGLTGATPAPWADKVVVTWAFPPNSHNFSIVGELVSLGFAIWWFDGDLGRARELYIARSGLPNTIRDFDAQTIRLAEAREEIARIYAGRMITTLTSSGYLSCAEILAIVST